MIYKHDENFKTEIEIENMETKERKKKQLLFEHAHSNKISYWN